MSLRYWPEISSPTDPRTPHGAVPGADLGSRDGCDSAALLLAFPSEGSPFVLLHSQSLPLKEKVMSVTTRGDRSTLLTSAGGAAQPAEPPHGTRGRIPAAEFCCAYRRQP